MGGTSWGSVQFTWSPGSSSIDWGDTIDTISQIITFFKNAGTSGTTILTVLENLGLSQAQALVTLLQYGIST